ncbi:MAG: FAD/NAD(P)-binding protein [Elusimicrobiota bacterium]
MPIECIVQDNIVETSNINTVFLKPKTDFHFRTGQFIEFTIPGVGEAPFTPSSSPLVTDKFEVTIMKVGRVTERIHALKKGDTIGIRGPFGKGYPIEKYYGKDVLILGGGVGLAPLRSLLLKLLSEVEKFNKIVLCYGSRSPEDVVYKRLFPEWKNIKGLEILRSVDRCPSGKWDETVGLVTCLLDKCEIELSNSVAIVCGPPIMMKFGTKKLLELGHEPENIYLSMEKNMSCGLGKCGHCQLGPYFVCKDGPVFTYEEIKNIEGIWD